MNSSRILTILCLVSAVLFVTSHCKTEVLDATFIQSACSKAPKPSLCVSVFKSDPRSSSADAKGLAKIMVDKIKANAEMTVKKIKGSYGQPKLKAGLDACLKSYNAILKGDVSQAKEALEKGNPKFADTAVADAGNEADFCRDRIAGVPKLVSLSKDMRNLCDIAKTIVKLLL